MTTVKYFSGNQEVQFPQPMRNAAFTGMFPTVRGKRWDGFSMLVSKIGDQLVPVTRVIEYKSRPSLHKCDGRCLHAKGRQCECECGGKNHGLGG